MPHSRVRCFGGHVIYFSGDAINCWFECDDGLHVTACGLAMQRAMDHLGEVVTPAGSRVRLTMKVAIAVGSARRFVVGDPQIQLIDVLAGRLIDALAFAERQARKGEVVLDRSALESLTERVEIRELRKDEDSGAVCAVVGRMIESPEKDKPRLASHRVSGGAREALAAARNLRALRRWAWRISRRIAASIPTLSQLPGYRLRP